MIDFDRYMKMGELGGKERAEAWKTASGLQAVDGLKTSEYLYETVAKHIEGGHYHRTGKGTHRYILPIKDHKNTRR